MQVVLVVSAVSPANNNPQSGSALYGGNGSAATHWGNGGGGGGGFFGGGGGSDDGDSWGGQGGGAGSSFIRGAITNYSTSAFNSTPTDVTLSFAHLLEHNLSGHGSTNSHMRVPYDYSSFGTGWSSSVNANGNKGHGGRENTSYGGSGSDGGHGAVFSKSWFNRKLYCIYFPYRKFSCSYNKLI